MAKLLALLQFVFALFGVDGGARTFVDRISVDGQDLLYSKVQVADGITRFDCLRSSSGRCHYTLLPPGCVEPLPAAAPDCLRHPLRRFAVARGESEQFAGLAAFQLCVSTTPGRLGTSCEPRPPQARH